MRKPIVWYESFEKKTLEYQIAKLKGFIADF
jgi:hypothetical protein